MSPSLEEVARDIKKFAADFIGFDPEKLDAKKKLRLEYGISSVEASEIVNIPGVSEIDELPAKKARALGLEPMARFER